MGAIKLTFRPLVKASVCGFETVKNEPSGFALLTYCGEQAVIKGGTTPLCEEHANYAYHGEVADSNGTKHYGVPARRLFESHIEAGRKLHE